MADRNRETSNPAAAAGQPVIGARSKRRRRMFVALMIVGVPIFLVGAGELLVRCYLAMRGWTPNCYAGSLDLFRPHDQLGCDLKPGFRLQSGTFRISVNKQGFRGPEVASDKPASVTRIAILGGSSAFGYLVSDGQEAARLLEDRLRAEGLQTEVINAGVPSYNLHQTLPRFRDRVAALKPDIVILYLGWNDLGYIVSDDPSAAQYRVRPVASAWQRMLGRSSLYGLIVFRLLGGSATLPAAELPGTSPTEPGSRRFRDNLATLIDTAQSGGAEVIVCGQVTAAHPQVDTKLRHFLSEDPQRQDEMIELGEWLRMTFASSRRGRRCPVHGRQSTHRTRASASSRLCSLKRRRRAPTGCFVGGFCNAERLRTIVPRMTVNLTSRAAGVRM